MIEVILIGNLTVIQKVRSDRSLRLASDHCLANRGYVNSIRLYKAVVAKRGLENVCVVHSPTL